MSKESNENSVRPKKGLSLADRASSDNNAVIFNANCSGWFPNYKRLANFLSSRLDTDATETCSALIQSAHSQLLLSSTYVFDIWLLAEQKRFSSLMSHYITQPQDVQILFFSLNSLQHAHNSYPIAKERFQLYNGRVKLHCLIGLHDPDKMSADALAIFDVFREAHSIENVLVCEYSPNGQVQYCEFMQAIGDKLLDIPALDKLSLPKAIPKPSPKHTKTFVSINHMKMGIAEGNLFDVLEWADLSLKENPSIFHSIDSSYFPQTFDFLHIDTKKGADQDLYTEIEKSEFNIVRIDTNPTKEYFLRLGHRLSFLQAIKKYASMVIDYEIQKEPLLHVASRFGYVHFITWLLDNGIPVDLPARDGRTALMVAACYGHEPLIRFLIQRGSNICHEDTNHNTALLLASQAGHFSVVKLLVEKYTNMALRSFHINMANVNAALHDNTPMMQYFLDLGADINFRTPQGISALAGAALYNSLTSAKFLLEHGAKPNTQYLNFQNELSAAVGNNSREMVDLLLAYGANVNFVGSQAITPLTRAAGTGQLALVKHLIKLGALLNIASPTLTPLIAASQEGHLDIVIFLVKECHVDIDEIIENTGETALIHAAYYNHFEVTRYLLDHNANIEHIKENGWTALTSAAGEGHRDIVSLLLSRGADPENRGNGCISEERLKIIKEEYAKLPSPKPMINSSPASEHLNNDESRQTNACTMM